MSKKQKNKERAAKIEQMVKDNIAAKKAEPAPENLEVILMVDHSWNLYVSLDKSDESDRVLAYAHLEWLKKRFDAFFGEPKEKGP